MSHPALWGILVALVLLAVWNWWLTIAIWSAEGDLAEANEAAHQAALSALAAQDAAEVAGYYGSLAKKMLDSVSRLEQRVGLLEETVEREVAP